jgi:hypothetical protein
MGTFSILGLAALAAGVLFLKFPHIMLRFNDWVHTVLLAEDYVALRKRYTIGTAFLVLSALLFTAAFLALKLK